MLSTPGPWLALVALANLIWYLVEWDQARSSGHPLSPLRHPALLFVQAVRKLARARQLVLPILGLWLLSGVIYWGVQRPIILRQMAADQARPTPRMSVPRSPGFARPALQPVGTLLKLGWEGLSTVSGRLPAQALRDCLPGPRSLRADLWSGYGQLLFSTIVLFCVASMVWHRPAWLGRANTLQPRLALAYLLVPLAVTALGGVVVYGTLPVLLWQGLHVLTTVAFIPLYAPVWHLLLQVARGRPLSLAFAVRSAMASLVPLTGYLALASMAPAVLWLALEALFPTHSGVAEAFSQVLAWLQLILIFVPWLILHERLGLKRALYRHWQLLQAHWPDLLAFAARYLLLIFPLQYIHAMFPVFTSTLGAGIMGGLVGGLTNLVTLLMVALLVLELMRATPRSAGRKDGIRCAAATS